MSAVEVWVSVAGVDVRAGTLYSHRRRGGGAESASFTYAAEYLADPRAYSLEPGLPLEAGAHQSVIGHPTFGAFGDCAPDRWGRTLVVRREAAQARAEGREPRSLGEADYLLGVRDDLRQGALRFRRADGPFEAVEEHGVPALTDLPELLDLAARAETDSADLSDLQRLVRVGSSLGGARPKAHVRDADGNLAIAKFPSAAHDTWNVMAWEKVALELAARAGITVPGSTLLDLAGRAVLVVDRFDRASGADGGAIGRVGYVSAMTMLRSTDGEHGSYLEVAEAIETRSSRATADLRQLWRRIVFSILVSNTDDHLRNHGFLHAGGDTWRLSPAFDLNPDPEPGPKHLSTTIDLGDDTASIPLALSVADYFRLDAEEAGAIVAQVKASVSQWATVARRCGLSSQEITAMSWAFEAHSARTSR
ncbi:type II toxin-antitoxin system HipA family toxin [Phycicoccus sp. CSK15P-2]|uniref:type II toxin-antitoxin system HipA family toxin n=1 Tax=Phycicoccus sp. CSK15P-2 TaxID=2807627 RepID=UPI00194DB5D3|nr:type II toxin-antitoxin system HipA family toxin [Phycicoccus sp. CSK15P-2]MBM6405884.1 type II toxin-antitoxin system HipA family toxin [Phycicoccus sp. CSK15P-2]